MKRIILLLTAVMLSVSMFAQKDVYPRHLTPIFKKDYSYAKMLLKKHPVHFSQRDFNTIDTLGVPIGLTLYDLQTNSAVAHRIYTHPDGTVSAVWLEDQENADGGSTRGTGYNYYDGTQWLYTTMEGTNVHVEANQRTGWPAYMVAGNNELVTNHYRSAGGLFLWTSAIGANGSGWTQGSIEGGFPEPMLWPRAVSTHGSDGNDHLYVIAVDDFNNSPEEITGLYLAQSHDGGQTWTAALLPGFTQHYHNGNGDIYAIDARDSIVAIAYFADYGDLMVWKSTDYGQTWDTLKVNDFPVDQYNFFSGHIVDMDNNNQADTVMSTDNTGDIIITPDGKVHVTFGVMRYIDEQIDNQGQFSYFPYTDGILYWNEDMGQGEYTGLEHANYVGLNVPDSVQLIAYSFDLNGNDTIWEYAQAGQNGLPFGKYYTSLTSMPSMATDDSGNIYVAFTTVMEGDDFVKTDANPNPESFRHAWIIAKPADTTGISDQLDENGWTQPYCISTVDGNSAENVFVNLARRVVDGKLHLWLQWDDEPGLHIRGDNDNPTNNYIVYKEIPVCALLKNIKYAVTFHVVDADNNPLQGAIITVGDSIAETDDQGIATMHLCCGEYTGQVALDGYQTADISFSVQGADLDLNITLTPPGSVFTTPANIKIAPNPTKNYIVINAEKGYTVEVMNLWGQVIDKFVMNDNTAQVDLSNYANGVYIVRLIGNKVYSYRVIKE